MRPVFNLYSAASAISFGIPGFFVPRVPSPFVATVGSLAALSFLTNSPLWYVVDEAYRASALVLQIDVFSGAGSLPRNLNQVQERAKDLQYARKKRFNAARVKEQEELRASLRRVLAMLPEDARSDPDVKPLAEISTRGEVALVHFTNRQDTRSSDFKDFEFSRATVLDLWEGGHDDVRHAIATEAWRSGMELAQGIRGYDLTPMKFAQKEPAR